MNSSRVFLVFMICSVIGWICEVLYVGIFYEHKFVNRGFLHGPVCPIYGFGGLTVLFLFEPWKDTWVALFLASFVILSLIEYVGSWVLETLFHTKWWDYSDKFCNINGRVCLLNSVLFGLMGLLGEHFLRPVLFGFLSFLDDRTADIAAYVLLAAFVIDILSTLRRLINFSAGMERLKAFEEQLKERYESESWFRKGSYKEMTASILERAQFNKDEFKDSLLAKIESLKNISRNTESLLKKFPTMKSKDYSDFIEELREYLIARKLQKKSDSMQKRMAVAKAKKGQDK